MEKLLKWKILPTEINHEQMLNYNSLFYQNALLALGSPGILNTNELYTATAYLLHLDGIIDKNTILNASTSAKIKMPKHQGFIDMYKNEENNQYD